MDSFEKQKERILVCSFEGTIVETSSGDLFPVSNIDTKIKTDVIDAIVKYRPKVVIIYNNITFERRTNGCRMADDVSVNTKMDFIQDGIVSIFRRTYGDDEDIFSLCDYVVLCGDLHPEEDFKDDPDIDMDHVLAEYREKNINDSVDVIKNILEYTFETLGNISPFSGKKSPATDFGCYDIVLLGNNIGKDDECFRNFDEEVAKRLGFKFVDVNDFKSFVEEK